jgi:hypothetical protein
MVISIFSSHFPGKPFLRFELPNFLVFYVFVLLVFVLCLVPNIVIVSELPIPDCPFRLVIHILFDIHGQTYVSRLCTIIGLID